jgi:hypothetical protein
MFYFEQDMTQSVWEKTSEMRVINIEDAPDGQKRQKLIFKTTLRQKILFN